MAQANCLPSAMRAPITGANQKSSTTQNRWTDGALSVIGASCHSVWRLA